MLIFFFFTLVEMSFSQEMDEGLGREMERETERRAAVGKKKKESQDDRD